VGKDFWQEEEREGRTRLRLGANTFSILALELALIRWMGGQIRIFAYFANLVLLAGFLGMGLGVAAGRRRPDLVRVSLPLLAVLSAVVAFSPQLKLVHLQLADPSIHLWGLDQGPASGRFLLSVFLVVALFWLVTAVFFFAAAPVGWLFDRLPPLRAYSADLAGSLLGVLAITALAALHTSPVVWMLVASVPLLWMAPRPGALLAAAAVLLLAAVSIRGALFSPYSRLDLERRAAPASGVDPGGEWVLSANRDFHQFLYDLSNGRVAQDPLRARLQAVYELPFRLSGNRGRALIVGAGGGNDVAAALRQGFQQVVSVEIDPLILSIGRRLHPEQPYGNARVVSVVNDARAYFEQNPGERFDVVCYGLLDSHSLFSSMSSLRLENYVYTVEGVRAAWSHVKPDGLLSICFAIGRPWIGQRMVGLLRESTGLSPVVLLHGMASGVTFVVGRRIDRDSFPTSLGPVISNPAWNPRVSLPTDDWPFLYLRPGVFPSAYVLVLTLILATSWLAIRVVYGRRMLRFSPFETVLFLMGAAFLLLETRMVTALSLLFGSTWIVNASVFSGILLTVFLANLFVGRHPPTSLGRWYIPLALALLATWAITPGQLNRLSLLQRGVLGGLLYALPVAFAGVIFSSLLKNSPDPTNALGSNLLGAVLGGLFEYSSMAIGLRSLTLIALALYLASFLCLSRMSVRLFPVRTG